MPNAAPKSNAHVAGKITFGPSDPNGQPLLPSERFAQVANAASRSIQLSEAVIDELRRINANQAEKIVRLNAERDEALYHLIQTVNINATQARAFARFFLGRLSLNPHTCPVEALEFLADFEESASAGGSR